MGRFIAIVIFLVALALLINRAMYVPDPIRNPEVEQPATSTAEQPAAQPQEESAVDSAPKPVTEDPVTEEPTVPAESTPAEPAAVVPAT